MQHLTPDSPDGAPRRAYARPTLERRDVLGAVTAAAVSALPDSQPSDVRLKEDIARIGTTAHGLPFYRFRYRGKPGLYEGVMAQEALRVMPQAVLRGEDGFLRVDYARLGAPFRRVQ
ncbi:MAG: tail fiber domain-containing protein [Acetobacteraceae bacterium]